MSLLDETLACNLKTTLYSNWTEALTAGKINNKSIFKTTILEALIKFLYGAKIPQEGP